MSPEHVSMTYAGWVLCFFFDALLAAFMLGCLWGCKETLMPPAKRSSDIHR